MRANSARKGVPRAVTHFPPAATDDNHVLAQQAHGSSLSSALPAAIRLGKLPLTIEFHALEHAP
jgi:hypothetical protein